MNETFQSSALALGPWDLVLASVLVLAAGAVSLALRLRLERRLALAAVRTVVQLLLVGSVLRYVLRTEAPLVVGATVLVMLAAGTAVAVGNTRRTHGWAPGVAFLTLLASSLLTAYTVTGVVIGVAPWFRPQYLIPLLGMILGNGVTALTLAMDTLLEHVTEKRAVVEMELAHGANRWEAAAEPLRASVRRGMLPIINAMMMVGLVSLPGMMTGQILAGADPVDAVKYQIVVMFMIAAATALACMGAALLLCWRLFDARHRLVLDAVRER